MELNMKDNMGLRVHKKWATEVAHLNLISLPKYQLSFGERL